MLSRIVTAILTFATIAATPSLSAQQKTPVTFAAPILDWNVIDLTGDGRADFFAITCADGMPREFVIAVQGTDGTFKTAPAIGCPADVVSFAIGTFLDDKKKVIALLSPDSVRLLAASGDGRMTIAPPCASIPHLFRSPSGGPPGIWHWNTDIDGDGHDDLFVPTDDGLLLLFGDGKGGFAETRTTIPIDSVREIDDSSAGAFDVIRSAPRPVFEDIAGDAALDVAWFDEKGLSFIEQVSPRVFAKAPRRFALPWLSGRSADGLVEQTDVSLADIDGDKKADLLLSKMQAKDGNITDMQTTLVCLMNDGSETAFPREPQLALRLKGIVGLGPRIRDLDGDGTPDLIYGTYAGGLTDAIARIFSRVPVTVFVHSGTGKKKTPFAASPDFTTKFTIDTKDFERFGARASLALGEDFDGDGIGDLYTMKADDEGPVLRVQRGSVSARKYGVAEKPLFTAKIGDFTGISFRRIHDDKKTAILVVHERTIDIIEAR